MIADSPHDNVATRTRTTTPAESRWTQVARELGPVFDQRASKYDADDVFVADNYADLRAAKLFSAAVPVELGGGGASYQEICAVIQEIGRHCGSTALAYSMHAHLLAAAVWRHHHNAVPSSEPLLRRMAADELVLVSSGGSDWLDGSGTLTRAEGGYRLKANKVFASGSPSGDLLMTTGVYEDPVAGPQVLHFGIPLNAPGVTILDNWHVMGMRGTGSHDVLIEDVFVGEGGISVRRPKGTWAPVFDVVSVVAWPLVYSAYLGVAEAARKIALEQAARRKQDPTVQALVGRMDTDLNTAQVMLDALVAVGASDFTPSIATSNYVYLTKTALSKALRGTVDNAMELASGAAFFRSLGLERRFRDIQGVRYHPWQQGKQALFSGRLALGLDPVGGN